MSNVDTAGEARFENVEALAVQVFDQMQDDQCGDDPSGALEVHDPLDPEAVSPLAQLGLALIQIGSGSQDKAATKFVFNDISYHAARARSGLPRGIELLESEPVRVSEEETSASIRRLMTEQKRVRSLTELPELSPPDLADCMEDDRSKSSRWRFIRLDVRAGICRLREMRFFVPWYRWLV